LNISKKRALRAISPAFLVSIGEQKLIEASSRREICRDRGNVDLFNIGGQTE
jgi:hypothetical protein